MGYSSFNPPFFRGFGSTVTKPLNNNLIQKESRFEQTLNVYKKMKWEVATIHNFQQLLAFSPRVSTALDMLTHLIVFFVG